MIDHPAHYGGADNPYEAIKVIEAWELGFCLGNAVKYISRAGKKPGVDVVEDLKKARWYLDREIGLQGGQPADLEEHPRDGRPVVAGFDPAQFRADRLEAGLTVPELARRAGVGRETVAAWERGETLPSRRLFPRVLDVLWGDQT